MRKILLLIYILVSFKASAQKIYGTVFNDKGDLLPYSSITIKGTTSGASANNRAKFAINVTPGSYTVVCQHIGYTAQEKKVTITNADEEVVFVLTEQKLMMKEVVVKSNGEDPAYQIIREAIKKRPYYFNQVNAFACDLYTKDMIKLRHLPEKIFGKKIPDADRQEMMLDTLGMGIIYLSESIAKIALQQPDKFKMRVISSRVSGSGSFGFSFPTFISLYQNNVNIFEGELNPRGFVSPIADGAIRYYKFKFLGSYWEDGREINSIRVTPRRSYEPLFSGIINITENDWRIHSFDLVLTKKSQLEIIDTLQITQFHVPVTGDVWRVKNQLLHFNFNKLGIDAVGNFVNVYSNYDVVPNFGKDYFNRVIIKYDTNVNKKTKTYWDSIRPVPLEKEEVKDYLVKDSMFERQRDSGINKFAIDSLKKKQGKIKVFDVFWNGINRTHYSTTNRYDWGIVSLIKNLEYNSAEGVVVNVAGYYEKFLEKSKVNFSFKPTLRYGFNNTHLNAWADLSFRTKDLDIDKEIRRQEWTFSGGKRVTQFNKESPIKPLQNSISTLFYGDNFMKTYENYFAAAGYSKIYENGLQLNVRGLYENRIPLNNTTNFTVFKNDSVYITPNYPYEKISTQFTQYQAVILSVDLSFQPGQKYIQFPYRKIAIGSDYPTLNLNYSKGIKNIFGSDVDFDKWRFSIDGEQNFKLAGVFKYNMGVGGFLNSKSVFVQDYHHFNGNRTSIATEYLQSFQIASYYAYSTTVPLYAAGHIEHNFNGFLTNKIPYFKRLNWNLVVGSNAFYIDEASNHVELFVGLENIFKIFRIDFVSAFENGGTSRTSRVVFGFGGLLGNTVNKTVNSFDKSNGF